MELTLEQLQGLCREWQERLGLGHWEIGLSITRAQSMPKKDVTAAINFDITNEYALIDILDPIDQPKGPFEQDMEVSLVHELLHIPMRYIVDPVDDTLEDILMEAFINRLARVLVRLKREGAKDERA